MESSEPKASVADERKQVQDRPPGKRRKPWMWLLVGLIAIGGGVGLWYLLAPKNQNANSAAQQQPPTKVRLATLESGAVSESSEYIANLESRRSVTLQPRIEGQVSRIFVRPGDRVNRGANLIQIDPEEQQAAVRSSSAAIAAAEAEVANAEATLSSLQAERLSNLSNVRFNEKEYKRYSDLADQGAVARSVADDYTNRIATAKAELNAIDKRIAAQKATVAQQEKALAEARANTQGQEAQLKYYTITAPFAGTVGRIPVKEGDFVNTSTQLTSVTENQPLEVNISVPIERGPELRQGMPVELLDGQGKRVGTSKVFFIAPNTATNTQSVLVKSLFENSQNQLRADQYVRARVIWNQRQGILVPTTAINRIGGQNFVYVAESAPQQQQSQQAQSGQPQLIARQKPVKLGSIQGNNYQVLEGLKPGERIVTSGLLNLRDGAPIAPES
ncbi:efflux transporter periplasmic adaptor subunit [cyanobacterium TDX16]|nr:efflux transporter periplasmic adaptor subunit [cyanobacterium TDX16]